MSGSNDYTHISNTAVNPFLISSLGQNQNLSFINSIVGFIAPTAIGVNTVVNAAGKPIILPPQIVVLSATMQSTKPIVGGTTLELGLAATSGGAVASTITGTQAVAGINTGIVVQPAVGSTISVLNQYLVVNNATVVTSGSVKIHLNYLVPLVA